MKNLLCKQSMRISKRKIIGKRRRSMTRSKNNEKKEKGVTESEE